MRAYRILAVLFAWATFFRASPALAVPIQTIDNPWKICARETAEAERQKGIPTYLLAAISLAEAGRWNAKSRENIAWPWTVTARGEGRYFASKRNAITHVYELWDAGVENIDVGCMQVNLRYHGQAFANLDEAFDPAANADYAARFLKELKNQTRSWTSAAAQYHSAIPAENRPYKQKVLKYWDQQRREAREESRRQRSKAAARYVSGDRRERSAPKKPEKLGKIVKREKKELQITGRGLLATWRREGSKAAANQALIHRIRAAARERETIRARFAPAKKAPDARNPFAVDSQPKFTDRGRAFFRNRHLSLIHAGD
jgi:hypothetical protein